MILGSLVLVCHYSEIFRPISFFPYSGWLLAARRILSVEYLLSRKAGKREQMLQNKSPALVSPNLQVCTCGGITALYNPAAREAASLSEHPRSPQLGLQSTVLQLLAPTGKLLREGSNQPYAEVSIWNHFHEHSLAAHTTLLRVFSHLVDDVW